MPLANDRFLRACRGEPVVSVPVWLMRQAGRYQPEYRALRARHSLIDLVRTPALAADVTMLPVDQLGVDAAILFSDILVVLAPMGVAFDYVKGDGPRIERPVRTAADVSALRPVEPRESLAYVGEAIRLVLARLGGRVPLIGFAGAPFTLASYMIEGGHSADFAETRRMMRDEPDAWRALMERLADTVLSHLRFQIESGAHAVQLFDSWVGCLSVDEYVAHVQPYARRIFDGLRGLGAPAIHFGTGTAHLLEAMRDAGGDVIGVDWRVPIGEARRRLAGRAVMGNLDPRALLGPCDEAVARAVAIVSEAGPEPGYVFNLGHGVLPETPVETARAVVEAVQGARA